MIITRTPFRISFFGGGTDYPAWFSEHGGAVIATSINKYCYISCRKLPQFFDHKHRIVYSKIETINDISEIEHPAVRAVLNWAGADTGLEIHHDADLPARSGLGSSSSFTVGLVHALNAFKGNVSSKIQLARDAIHIEQDLIRENVGSQDQISAAYGGLNRIDFHRNGKFNVEPLILPLHRREELNNHFMLFFTGFTRFASEIAKSQIKNIHTKSKELAKMSEMVEQAIDLLQDEQSAITQFGELLDQNWSYKRSLSEQVTTPEIDDIYARAKKGGAIGGKLLGAGGGGFMLLFVSPEKQENVRNTLKELIHVPFEFDDSGSRVVLYHPNGL